MRRESQEFKSHWEAELDDMFYSNIKRKKKYIDTSIKKIECNLCGKKFIPDSKYARFCEECKVESELLQSYY